MARRAPFRRAMACGDRFAVVNKRGGWIAMTTWSQERAEAWIRDFDPSRYMDKSLRAEDFEIRERGAEK